MKTNRLITMLLVFIAAQVALSAHETVDAKRAKIPIPVYYYSPDIELTPDIQKWYWERRDKFYEESGLSKIFKRDVLDKIDFIENKEFDHLLISEGYKPYDSRIKDPYGEVFYVVNEGPKKDDSRGFFPSVHIPNEIPGDTILIKCVVEIDGSIGPIYMTKGHSHNLKGIAESLRQNRYIAPATWQNKPVRVLQCFTVVTRPPRKK